MSSSIEVANIALILGVVVVLIASITWEAGIVASLIAATGLNYFCTEPIHSLRVTSGDDLLTIFLLVSLGLGVSAITGYRAQRAVHLSHRQSSVSKRQALHDLLLVDTPVSSVWESARQAVAHELDLVTVRVSPATDHTLPIIARHAGNRSSEYAHIVIPQSGAVLPFSDPRLTEKLIFTPRPGVGTLTLQRDLVFLFASHIEAVLAGTL